jgi:hypothetical protein
VGSYSFSGNLMLVHVDGQRLTAFDPDAADAPKKRE